MELRQACVAAGLTATDVATHFSWAPSKLTRLETAENGIVEPSDVTALCNHYGLTPDETAVLVAYATVTKTKRDWWQRQDVRDVIQPGFKAYLGLEASASSLENYEAEFVPGLLQTEDYVREILGRGHQGLSREQLDLLVAVRMTRQEVLHREPAPLEFTAIINEAVLRRRVGSRDLMRGQLDHIVNLVESSPHVKVQVVPFDLGAHPGMNGSFTFLKFPKPLRPIVYLENLAGAGVSRREADVRRYEIAFSDLKAAAPGYEKSLSMIKNASKEH
ncbi:helix-turn-helix domain-containing protein [Streptomyces sp. NPDC054865]